MTFYIHILLFLSLGLGPEVQFNSVNGKETNNKKEISLRKTVLQPELVSGRPTCAIHPEDTFCEYVENYPSEIVLEIPPRKDPAIRLQEDDPSNEEPVCRSVPRLIYPQVAMNEHNHWVYVVNGETYTQGVMVDICQKPKAPCLGLESLPPGQVSVCKQKYSTKILIALHPNEERTYRDRFQFPSSCVCYIRYADDRLTRALGNRK